jgi:outer membrane protein assembly factor BamB
MDSALPEHATRETNRKGLKFVSAAARRVALRRQRVWRMAVILSGVAYLLPMFESRAADWPQFRGPTGLGYTIETNLPLHWNAQTGEGIAWKAPLPKSDNAYSSPIVSGGRVYVTSAVNQPLEHHVLCFDANDGRMQWDKTVPPGPWLLKDLRGGYGAPTPCADGQRVIVVFGSAVIACLDYDGKILWRRELEKLNFDVAMGSSPVLSGDVVVLDCDQNGKTSSIIAFDRKSGEVRWEAKRPQVAFAHSTPVLVEVNNSPQLLVSASNAIQGLDPATGEILWWCSAAGDASSPAYFRGRVFSDSGRGGRAVCVDPTGLGDVTRTHLKWTFPQIPEGLSSAIVVSDAPAVPGNENAGKARVYRTHNPETLKCIDFDTGEFVYTERLPGVSTWASPMATPDGRIYFASAGKSYVMKAGPVFSLLATNNIGEENRASAAVSGGRIFLRGNKSLYCVGMK